MDINLKAKKVLDIYSDDKQDIDYVKEQLGNNNYILLPESIAINNVFKVIYEGDLEKYGYEKAYLYLPLGSGIKKHVHTNDVEQYTLICGIMSINGDCEVTHQCLLGDVHNIDLVDEYTIVKTLKIKKEFINNYVINEEEYTPLQKIKK